MLHFQVTLNDIEVQIEQHSSHNAKLQQENMDLADKFQKLNGQYELRGEVRSHLKILSINFKYLYCLWKINLCLLYDVFVETVLPGS